jgi:hypothetical protein
MTRLREMPYSRAVSVLKPIRIHSPSAYFTHIVAPLAGLDALPTVITTGAPPVRAPDGTRTCAVLTPSQQKGMVPL